MDKLVIKKKNDFYKNSLFYTDESNYPLYNIEKMSIIIEEGEYYRITLAVAGFEKEELNISTYNNTLKVSGSKISGDSKSIFIHKSISSRSFEKSFELSDSMVVKNSVLKSGLLYIYILRHVIPKQNISKIDIMSETDFISRNVGL